MRRSIRPFLPGLALGALMLTASATPAEAYRFAGPRWPSKVITVYNSAPRYEGSLRRALSAWNKARVGVRFRRAAKDRARVVVKYGLGRGRGVTRCEGPNGRAHVGYPGPEFQTTAVEVRRACRSPRARLVTIVHELGHVLGLGHDNHTCAIMNGRGNIRTGLPAGCRGRAAKRLLRRLLARDDVKGARALYRRSPPSVNPAVARINLDSNSVIGSSSEIRLRWSAAFRNPRLLYQWNFGDPASGAANTATGLDADHLFTSAGAYTITLTVIDGGAVIATGRFVLILSHDTGRDPAYGMPRSTSLRVARSPAPSS